MVMNAEIDWTERCKAWNQKKADYFSAQQTLDDAVSLYLETKGPPPDAQTIKQVEDLRAQMLMARADVDEFIATHAIDDRLKRNLPRHE